MKKLIALLLLTACSSTPNIFKRRQCYVPTNTVGYGTINFKFGESTKVDRGYCTTTNFSGGYRFYQESIGSTLYLYEGVSLKARIVNPESVEYAN